MLTETPLSYIASREPVILEVVTRAERGGAQVHLAEFLAQAQGTALAQFHVAAGESGYLEDVCRDLRIPFHVLPNMRREIRPYKDARAYRELLGLARELRPDIIHGHTAKAGLLTRLVGLRLGIPSVYTPHGFSFGARSGKWLRSMAWMFELAARIAPSSIVAVCQHEAELAVHSRVASSDQVHLIANGIADTDMRARPIQTDAPIVTMVARFAAPKDHALLLTASALVDVPHRIVLAGQGPLLAQSIDFAAGLGIADRVAFIGECSNIQQIYAQASIAALASESEALPLSLIEGMRAGLPVVATAVGGIAELVVHGETGLLSEPGDLNGFARNLRRLVRDAGLRERLGGKGRLRYEQHFRAESMTSSLLNLYQGVMEKPCSVVAEIA